MLVFPISVIRCDCWDVKPTVVRFKLLLLLSVRIVWLIWEGVGLCMLTIACILLSLTGMSGFFLDVFDNRLYRQRRGAAMYAVPRRQWRPARRRPRFAYRASHTIGNRSMRRVLSAAPQRRRK